MKKYLVFMVSFILLYFVYQLGTGLLLTLTHTPDFSGSHTQPTRSNGSGTWDLLAFIVIASLAYVFSQMIHVDKK